MKILMALQIVFYLLLIGFMINMWVDHYRSNKRHKKAMLAHKKVVATLNQAQREKWPIKKLYYCLISLKEQIGEDAANSTMINLMINEMSDHVK